jgi:hypothetical protein
MFFWLSKTGIDFYLDLQRKLLATTALDANNILMKEA